MVMGIGRISVYKLKIKWHFCEQEAAYECFEADVVCLRVNQPLQPVLMFLHARLQYGMRMVVWFMLID